MIEMTMKGWLSNGYRLVEQGGGVRIMGRRPRMVRDDLSPRTEYGWQRGDQWHDDTVTASSTLPAPIFRHLPTCANPRVRRLLAEGNEVMPRWPSESSAFAALDRAAWDWALALRTEEHIDMLIEIWVHETHHLSDRGRITHASARAIVALGESALPALRKLAKKYLVLYCLIEEIEDQ